MRQPKFLLIVLALFIQIVIFEPVVAAVQYNRQAIANKVAPPPAEKAKQKTSLTKRQKRRVKKVERQKRRLQRQLQRKHKQQLTSKASKETKLGRFFLVAGIIAILLSVLIFSLPELFMTSLGLTILFSIIGAISMIGAIVFPIMAIIYFAVGIAKKDKSE